MPDWLAEHEAAERARQVAAQVDGQHYTKLVPMSKVAGLGLSFLGGLIKGLSKHGRK
jgi:hypothetical protein